MLKNNIIQFKRQKLFKNAFLVDLTQGKYDKVDILVEGEKIVKIAPEINAENAQTENLYGDFVMPPFVNFFCNSEAAMLQTYGLEVDGQVNVLETSNQPNMFKIYGGEGAKGETFMPMNNYVMMKLKNYLAGAVLSNDFGPVNFDETIKKYVFVENIESHTESELDAIYQYCHQNSKIPVLRVGRTLEELGTIDKMYKKPLSQVLEDFGFLDLHPVIVGGNCFEKDELATLKQHDCLFVVTPFEDGKVGIRPTNLYRLKNMDFSIGIASGNTFEINFFEYMRVMIMQMRSMFESEEVFSEQDALNISLLGKTTLCEGDAANFIVVRNDNSLYDDIFKTLVWEKNSSDVVMTVDCGEIVQKNGKITIQDVPDYDKLKLIARKLTRRNKNDN